VDKHFLLIITKPNRIVEALPVTKFSVVFDRDLGSSTALSSAKPVEMVPGSIPMKVASTDKRIRLFSGGGKELYMISKGQHII